MKKISFGLNFKILIGICILLLVCTGFNLLYSYNLFIEDKTSYIYEAGLKRSENIVQQIQTHIESFRTKAQTYSFLSALDSFNFAKYINEESEYLVTGNLQLSDSAETPISVTNFVKSDSFANQNWKTEPDQEAIKNLVQETMNKKERGDSFNDIEFIHDFHGNDFLLSLYKNPGTKTVFFSFIDMAVVNKYVASDNIFSSQIVFLNSRQSKAQAQNEWLKSIDYKSIKKGTQEITFQGVAKLLSYAATPNYIITSSIDRDKAFGITKFLVIKTSLFACVLLGIAVACGIYFSSTITHPIEVLTAKSEQLAAGDFDQPVVVNTSDELSVLAKSFNWMSEEIKGLLSQKEDMILQLEDYSKNLEKKVEQRTIELKNANDFMGAMINSLDQGLFVFDQSLECHDVYTNACVEIFGTTPPHKKFTEVLGITDESELGNVTQWAAILFSEMIPFESAVNLGPRTKVQGTDYTDPNFKHIQIDYYPMKDEDSKIKSIVSVGTDKTSEIQAVEKKKENDQYVSMIIKILNNKTHFKSFCDEADSILAQFTNVYNEEKNEVQFDLAMILFHTLNGGFGMYSLMKLQAEARSYESQVTIARENNVDPREYNEMLKTQVASLKENFTKMKGELDSLLGTSFQGGETYKEIPLSTIMRLQDLINLSAQAPLKEIFYEEIVKEPVINYFKAYEDVCFKAAEKTGKQFAGIEFTNQDLKVDPAPLLEFFNVLIHLFRNCIDHGIEAPYKREELGKNPAGRIAVSFDMLNNSGVDIFYLNIQDDGGGINAEIIKKKYTSMYPDIDISNYSEKDIINIIFDPFFSTRDEVSALSGRGVGMSAIKEVVDKLGGRINIETRLGVGSSFAFFIPVTPNA